MTWHADLEAGRPGSIRSIAYTLGGGQGALDAVLRAIALTEQTAFIDRVALELTVSPRGAGFLAVALEQRGEGPHLKTIWGAPIAVDVDQADDLVVHVARQQPANGAPTEDPLARPGRPVYATPTACCPGHASGRIPFLEPCNAY